LFTFLLTKLLGFIKQQQLYLNATCCLKLVLDVAATVLKAGDVRSPALITSDLSGSETQRLTK